MPNSNTFDVPCIGEFVKSYLRESKTSVDPFARNKNWATCTNDLNPTTSAQCHMEALEYLGALYNEGKYFDLAIFDPPYSPRQVSECYSGIGKAATQADTQASTWADWRSALDKLIPVGGIVLSFGWNSIGMGKKHNYKILEIMLVCHGGQHNDTICMAEIKEAHQPSFFSKDGES